MSTENEKHSDSIQIPIELPGDLREKIESAVRQMKEIALRSPVPPHANCKGGVPPECKIDVYKNVFLDNAGVIVFEITATAVCPNVGKCHTYVIWELDPVKRVFFDKHG